MDLKNIDGKATKEKLEKVFRQYRTYTLTTPEELLPTITPKYTLEMSSFGGLANSKTENAAIRNVELFREAESFFERFNRAMYKLSLKERRIIVMSFLEEEPRFDYEIYNEIGVSESTFYRIKPQALYKLALALNKVAYQEQEVSTK